MRGGKRVMHGARCTRAEQSRERAKQKQQEKGKRKKARLTLDDEEETLPAPHDQNILSLPLIGFWQMGHGFALRISESAQVVHTARWPHSRSAQLMVSSKQILHV